MFFLNKVPVIYYTFFIYIYFLSCYMPCSEINITETSLGNSSDFTSLAGHNLSLSSSLDSDENSTSPTNASEDAVVNSNDTIRSQIKNYFDEHVVKHIKTKSSDAFNWLINLMNSSLFYGILIPILAGIVLGLTVIWCFFCVRNFFCRGGFFRCCCCWRRRRFHRKFDAKRFGDERNYLLVNDSDAEIE